MKLPSVSSLLRHRASIAAGMLIVLCLFADGGVARAEETDTPKEKAAAAPNSAGTTAPAAPAPATPAPTTPAPVVPAPATAAAPAPAAPAAAAPKPKRKKVQEVDPRRLEIQGQIESPKSTFILESGTSLIPDIGSLDALLRGPLVPPIDKETFDAYVFATIEKGDRP